MEQKKHEFRYTEPFANHMAHRHHIDDHNNLRHQQPSIEETWKTQTWENRVFAFLLAVTEVNVFKYFIHFVWGGKEKMTLHKFRKELALDLIYNNAIMQELGEDDGGVVKKKLRTSHAKEHLLKTAPANACEFAHGKWKKHRTMMYPERTCKTSKCTNRTRTYCSCHPGLWMCTGCWGDHRERIGRSDCSER